MKLSAIRLAGKTAFLALLSATLIMIPIVGCNVDQVVAAINTAADVAIQAGNIVTPINPAYGAVISATGVTLKDLADLYAQYEAAPADQKSTLLAKIHTVLNLATANLSTILADSHIKAPGLMNEVRLFVAIANSSISLIINHLPKSTSLVATAAEMQSRQLPVVPQAKSAKDLKKAWNDAVQASHPEARI
jgi:hypothetical protein